MSHSNEYTLSPAVKAAFRSWWLRISDEAARGTARADRANLKRAHDLDAVACTPAYQRAYRELLAAHEGAPWKAWQQERIAALTALAAHIKSNNDLSVPKAMSAKAEGQDRNPVSELRFARLLDSPDLDALFTGLRRALPLIDHKLDPLSLADDLFGWGDRVKKTWAYDYDWREKA